MRKKLCFILLISILAISLFSVVGAFAAEPAVTTASATSKTDLAANAIKKSFESIGDKLHKPAIAICVFLAGMQFIWNLSVGYITEGKFDMTAFTVAFTRSMVTMWVCYWMVDYCPTFFKGMQEGITGLLGNKPSSLTSLISTAFDMAQAPQDALSELTKDGGIYPLGWDHWLNDFKYVPCALAGGIASFIILVAMFMAYLTALVTEAKLIITSAFSVLAVGFCGCNFTRDIARRGVGQVFSTCVELLVIYTLMAASQDVFNSFRSVTLTDWGDAYAYSFQCVLAGLILSALYQQIPGIISGMFGGIGGGGSALAGLAMAGAAATKLVQPLQIIADKLKKSPIGNPPGPITDPTTKNNSIGKKIAGGVYNAGVGAFGAVSAVRQHMPNAANPNFLSSPQGLSQKVGDLASRVGSGIAGAAKEGLINRASSMREAISAKKTKIKTDFNTGVQESADRWLGRKPGSVEKG